MLCMEPEALESVRRLVTPVAVFDGGIGSYDLVRRIRAAHPEQDVIHLADRASFPYGTKTEQELLRSVSRATEFLTELGASVVVLASNAPSVTVLDALRVERGDTVPILGVLPPIGAALAALPSDGRLVVAGASVLIDSPALRRLIATEAGTGARRVTPAAADALVALVERGGFLDPERALAPVAEFVDMLRHRHRDLAGICLSSTHLPWLAPVFAEAAPELSLFDPADGVVAEFAAHATRGSGRLVCLATESPAHPLSEFRQTLAAMRLELDPEPVRL